METQITEQIQKENTDIIFANDVKNKFLTLSVVNHPQVQTITMRNMFHSSVESIHIQHCLHVRTIVIMEMALNHPWKESSCFVIQDCPELQSICLESQSLKGINSVVFQGILRFEDYLIKELPQCTTITIHQSLINCQSLSLIGMPLSEYLTRIAGA